MLILYINVSKTGRKSKEMVNIKILWKTLTLGSFPIVRCYQENNFTRRKSILARQNLIHIKRPNAILYA